MRKLDGFDHVGSNQAAFKGQLMSQKDGAGAVRTGGGDEVQVSRSASEVAITVAFLGCSQMMVTESLMLKSHKKLD